MGADKLPFQSFSFSLVENRRPRTSFRLEVASDGMYDLTVQKGSAAHPSKQVKRKVPVEVAERLRDALQEIGVFGWDGRYGDGTAPGSMRWSLGIVFQEGVFSLEAKGGSETPSGFDDVLEELYRLDFPRPSGSGSSGATSGVGDAINSLGIGRLGSVGGMSAGDLGAYASSGSGGFGGVDFSSLGELFAGGALDDVAAEAQRDPKAFERRLKDEFQRLSPEERRQLIDALVASGMGSRDFWERFFRG